VIIKLSSDGGDSGSKKCKRGCSGTSGGVWPSLRLAEVWSLDSGSRLLVVAFGRNVASVAVTMFSRSVYLTKGVYELCTCNAICKDSAAISFITVQLKKSILVNFDVSNNNSILSSLAVIAFQTCIRQVSCSDPIRTLTCSYSLFPPPLHNECRSLS
jgi:hypothetical protein